MTGMRKKFSLSICGFVLVGLIACSPNQEPDELDSRIPNIIFVVADDLGYGELGVYGQSIIETPNIDALAASGMRFTQHYAGAPVCAPSRCVLLTGNGPSPKDGGWAFCSGGDQRIRGSQDHNRE